jgi:serine/threonine-protein kinase
MSVVYKVEHTLLLKHMALKLLRPELSSLPSVVERFQQEARSVCQLDDPNIVRVTDFGRQLDGSLYLVMDFLEGESLANRLRRDGKIPPVEAVDIGAQILAGLAHAHMSGVVHRDLKPENIMLVPRFDRIQVKILDFGIAKLAHRDTVESAKQLTQAGTVFGTPRYMSPEQASAERVDLRADLYAVGVILYECFGGQPPFDGPSAVKILSRVLTEAPPPLNLTVPTPKEGRLLEAVVMKALEKEKEDRYPSAFAFRDALTGVLGKR